VGTNNEELPYMELADTCHTVMLVNRLGTADDLVIAVTSLDSMCLRLNKLFLYLYRVGHEK
jgi:hypothetical protein